MNAHRLMRKTPGSIESDRGAISGSDSDNADSIAAEARRWAFGHKWPYVSDVVWIDP